MTPRKEQPMSVEDKMAQVQGEVKKKAVVDTAMRELGLSQATAEHAGAGLDEETRNKLEFFMKNGDLAGIYNVIEHKLKYDPKLTTLLNASAFRDEVTKMFRRQFAGKGAYPSRRLVDTRGLTIPGAETGPSAVSGRLGIIFIDLDDFKKLNDTRGHLAGDEALLAVARALTEGNKQGALREADIKGRFGGEELVVAIETEHESDHYRVAEKVRKLISEIKVKHGNQEFNVTASVGAAELQPGESYADIMERANWAMKFAKAHGKNQVAPEEVDVVRKWVADQKELKAKEDEARRAAQ